MSAALDYGTPFGHGPCVTGDELLVVERPFEISVTPEKVYLLGR
ncbi:hypothetical protein [Nocardia sp. NPDC046763]